MGKLRAKVQGGRQVVDESTTLPEGTVLELVVDDEGDDLTDAERAALHADLESSARQAENGETRRAIDAIADLRQRP